MRAKTLVGELRTFVQDVKTLKKTVVADNKSFQKLANKGRRTRKNNANGKLSGIQAPQRVTTELADFFGMGHDELVSRVESARRIHKYMNDNNLKDPSNKRFINCDEKLVSLFNLPKDADTRIDGHGLQRFIKHHFIKQTAETTEASA